jgi:undecaprenyl diphosphate synthase
MVKEIKKIEHIAIIMDGNGRWAEKHGLSRIEGHKQGAEAVKKTIKTAGEMRLKYLTLYAFSTENWKRSEDEVSALMDLLSEFLDHNIELLHENKIRLKAIGRINQLPDKVYEKLKRAVSETSVYCKGTLILALNYGGRAEIADAAQKIAKDVEDKKINYKDIDETLFKEYLYDSEIPDPDLMIRTSGELRLSNFLLWELAYSEFYVTDVLWPDFDEQEFKKAINAYYNRERRFGGR